MCEPDTWLCDEGQLDIRPGGDGLLTDEGVTRRAVVERVDEGRRVVVCLAVRHAHVLV